MISLDSVQGLGDFIELEFDGTSQNEEEVKKYLFDLIKELNIKVETPIFKGYPYLLLENQGLLI